MIMLGFMETEKEFIKTLPIKEWQKEKTDLHKIPAIFVLGQ